MTHRPILRNKDSSVCSNEISDLRQNVLSILLCEGRLDPHDGCKATANRLGQTRSRAPASGRRSNSVRCFWPELVLRSRVRVTMTGVHGPACVRERACVLVSWCGPRTAGRPHRWMSSLTRMLVSLFEASATVAGSPGGAPALALFREPSKLSEGCRSPVGTSV